METVSVTTPFPLWPWQTKAIERFGLKSEAYLNHEMGLGKTITTLILLLLIRGKFGRLPRTIIFAPVSTLFNWLREAQSVFPEFGEMLTVCYGDSTKKADAFDEAYQRGSRAFVTNHESLISKYMYERMKALRPEVVVVDEAQRVKNRKAKRTKALFPLADQASYRILLSGTPVTNDAEDIWAQLRILGGAKYVDANFFVFLRRYFFDKNAAWVNKPQHFPDYQLNPQTADAFRRMIDSVIDTVKKKDVLDLPEVVRAPRFVPLSSSIEMVYRGVERDYLACLEDDVITVDMALTRLLRLLQICSGVVKTDSGEELFLETEKYAALEDVLEEFAGKEKVIIWTPWRATYKPIIELCKKLGLKGVYCAGTNPKTRQESIDAFQTDPSVRVFLANPASMGVGVNLQAASVMVYYAKTYNLEHDLQSEARAHRANSKHERILRVDLITTGTEEESVEEALRKKVSLQNFIFSRKSGLETPVEHIRAVEAALDVFYGRDEEAA